MTKFNFEVKSGYLRITDPCYNKEMKDYFTKKVNDGLVAHTKALNGKWTAEIVYSDEGSWGRRVAQIVAQHEEHRPYHSKGLAYETIGVDSGQAGIFDDAYFPEGESTGDYDDKTSFYGKVCDLTQTEEHAGVIDNFGVVSSSGFGDGSYDVEISGTDEKEATKIVVTFIGDEEEEDDYDDYDDNEDEEDY